MRYKLNKRNKEQVMYNFNYMVVKYPKVVITVGEVYCKKNFKVYDMLITGDYSCGCSFIENAFNTNDERWHTLTLSFFENESEVLEYVKNIQLAGI